MDFAAVSPGGWLRAPADTDEADPDLGILALDSDDDGFERMARAVARTYASEDTDDDEVEEFFDDEEDDAEGTPAEAATPAIGLAVEAEEDNTTEQPEN